MAIWQFDCNIIPRIDKFTRTDTLDITSWIGIVLNKKAIQYLNQILEPQKSWTKDIIQFGKDDETCIKFLKEKEEIDEISCRLDLRTLKREDIQNILTFINESGGELYYLNKVYPATMAVWIELIKSLTQLNIAKIQLNF
ncbi:hypothetical protein SAMN05443270_1132 [Lacrimispora sphenoides]|uniref:hypothetical protein n=1 Tax=Lacrimispora sphenoides TaxID=29370 RepID=UPI0008BEEC9A|nr:hypothetical protein [Lacrimispora sphenoides]SET72386.1 hypothetical protein SAMN05443270_1132 [Lacrimispora sphenoides]